MGREGEERGKDMRLCIHKTHKTHVCIHILAARVYTFGLLAYSCVPFVYTQDAQDACVYTQVLCS